MDKPLDLSNVRIYSNTKEEELTKVKNAIAALLESLSHYTDRYGVKAYWDSYEGYEEFINSVVEACNIIEKEFAKFKEGKEITMNKEIDKVVASTDGEIHDNSTNSEQLWKEIINVGNSFWIRSKDNTEIVHLVTVTEISFNSEGSIVSIGLGANTFSPEELLKNYEWSSKAPKDNDWRPFSTRLLF